MAKDIATLRELFNRMRDKTDETVHSLIDIRSEVDLKMSSKEGQKLWTNFRKYAQYDELQELYRKTMPAISSFEDKLQQNNDHNERLDKIIKRIDEVLCQKADKSFVKEFKDYSEHNYATKIESDSLKSTVQQQIKEFGERCTQVEEMVKFQSNQL